MLHSSVDTLPPRPANTRSMTMIFQGIESEMEIHQQDPELCQAARRDVMFKLGFCVSELVSSFRRRLKTPVMSHVYHLEPTLTCYLLGGAVSRGPPVASSALWKHSAFFPVDDSCPGHGADFSEALVGGGGGRNRKTHTNTLVEQNTGLQRFAHICMHETIAY